MDLRCDTCGRPAQGWAHFRRVGRGHRCPACFARRQHLRHRLAWAGFLAWLALGLAAGALPPSRFVGWAALGLVFLRVSLVVALLPVAVLLHEAGHALAAWLLGLRVFAFTLGYGRLVGAVRLFGVRWQLRAVPSLGLTEAAVPTPHFLRARYFLMTLGGPLMNAAVLAAAAWWAPPTALLGRALAGELAAGPFAALLFAGANGLLLVLTLLPYQQRLDGGVHASDGWQLLAIPFWSWAPLASAQVHYFVREEGECQLEGRHAEALGWYERGLALDPEGALPAYGVAMARFGLRQFEEARQCLNGLLARPDVGRGLRAILADGVATVLLAQVGQGRAAGESPARLAEQVREGERSSLAALNDGSRLPLSVQWSLMGTYACFLVEQGRLDEGAPILRLALTEVEEPSAKAYCLCYLALVAARQGRAVEARAALEKARHVAPHCLALERAEWELAQGA